MFSVVRIIFILSVVEERRGVNGGKERSEYFPAEGAENAEEYLYQNPLIRIEIPTKKGKMDFS